jgi:hypothetical protein
MSKKFKIKRIVSSDCTDEYYVCAVSLAPSDDYPTIFTASCQRYRDLELNLKFARRLLKIQNDRFSDPNFKYKIEYAR